MIAEKYLFYTVGGGLKLLSPTVFFRYEKLIKSRIVPQERIEHENSM